jgi:hypothetical protein
LLCGKSERFAQDDGFVRGLEMQVVGCRKHVKIEKVTGSQDDGFVGVLMKNIPGRLTLMGLPSWVHRET